jgi:hypothetical protein
MTTRASVYSCKFCGDAVDPKAVGIYRQVEGWVGQRSSGGANSIKKPGPPKAYAHGICLEVDPDAGVQTSLF